MGLTRAIQEAGIALAVGFSGLTRPIVDTEAGWGRLVRARLALYLRARLRLDAGGDETGPWWCCRCGVLRCAAWECSGEPYHQRIRPLWEMAPSHGGGR